MLSRPCCCRYSIARTPSIGLPSRRTVLSLAARIVGMTIVLLVLHADGCVDVVDGAHGPNGDVDADNPLREVELGRVHVDDKGGILAVGGGDQGPLALHPREGRDN